MNHYHIEPDLLALRDFSYEVRHHLGLVAQIGELSVISVI